MKKLIVAMLFMLASMALHAGYNANTSSEIKHVAIYTEGDYIYFSLKNPPEHPVCKNTHFVIDGSVSYERRQMLLSRLLMAYASKEVVNIGYDGEGNCAHGYVRVYRVG